MVRGPLRHLKNLIAPKGRRIRRLPVGIGSGIRLSIDFRSETGLYLGLYERELNKHITALCRPGAGCFDVGGHLGYDALVLAKLSKGGRVASFEAEADRCARIEEAVRANPSFASRVTVHNTFVGRAPGGEAVIALDEFAYDSDGFIPDVIKMDIEGAELDALAGAQRLLSERKPGLIVEVHSAELEEACAKLLRRHAYVPEVVRQRRLFPDNRPAGDVNRWLVARGRTSAGGG
jgi:hypothetical protein